jgi:hypothetical protein
MVSEGVIRKTVMEVKLVTEFLKMDNSRVFSPKMEKGVRLR